MQPVATPAKSSGCGKSCGITRGVLLALLVLVDGGGYWAFGKFVISNPAAFVGKWEVVSGKGKLGEKFEFGLTSANDGVKLVSVDGKPFPAEVVFKPSGMRTVKATI